VKHPARPPKIPELLAGLKPNPNRLAEILATGIRPTVGGQYRHWDTLRQLKPPDGLTHREWWLGMKFARMSTFHRFPLDDEDGNRAIYSVPDPALEMLHQIDQKAGGRIGMSEAVTNPATRNQYLVSSLIEEAIRSSQLEGATTSRKVAKELLRTGRDPRTRSERMIVNNYVAMNTVRGWTDRDLRPEDVLELQRIVTDGTLDNPDGAGRLQRPGEIRVGVFDRITGQRLHTPPPAEQLPDRLEAMCRFANGQQTEGFLHPVVRAILIHFWLAFDHPFEDGNGRTARALFYWSMLRSGFWLTEYLSISRILTEAPSRYGRAFLFTETDDLDATYFILFQLGVITRAIKDLDVYLEAKTREIRETRDVIKKANLNHRQADLIRHALRHPDADYTFKGHAVAHGVVYQSARSDLLDLESRGLLGREVVGQTLHFWPESNLADRLSGLATGH
jgi:Fic family protein